MKLAVLIASYNRRDATLCCMSRLLPQIGEDARVYLVDDGSTDGTAVSVAGLKDKRIKVINGDGSLFWAKGMRKAWEAAAEWIRDYEPRVKSIELTDIKRFFNLNPVNPVNPVKKDLHLLYLGRRHPLKGLSYLETALATYYNKWSSAPSSLAPTTACADNPSSNPSRKAATYYNKCPIEFRVVSDAFGDELERVWDWCDVLVLPTLSENFGLVIAEALERGKRVITTDGAPAWGDGNDYGGRLVFLKGFRDGTDEVRVGLLKDAIAKLVGMDEQERMHDL
jgi:glycosyltransferase involved in cell wall biosynthesis